MKAYSAETTMKNTRTYLSTVGVFVLALILSACGRDRNSPGIQYAPEMYESIPYEPFKQVADSITPFKDEQTLQFPPEGTIARGKWASYEYPNSEEDSIRHGEGVKSFYNPLRRTAENMESAEELYLRFCGACHGKKGAGKGKVSTHPAINPQPYNAATLAEYTQGEVYYVIMHGKGIMGSYASQLEYEDRLKVLHYVEGLQGITLANEYPAFSDAVLYKDAKDEITGDPIKVLQVKKGNGWWIEGAEYGNGEDGQMALNAEAKGQALAYADFIKEFSDDYQIMAEVQTHAFYDEATMDSATAMATTQAQADAFVAELRDAGVPYNWIKAAPMGATMPVNRNITIDHQNRNLRTEILVTEVTEIKKK